MSLAFLENQAIDLTIPLKGGKVHGSLARAGKVIYFRNYYPSYLILDYIRSEARPPRSRLARRRKRRLGAQRGGSSMSGGDFVLLFFCADHLIYRFVNVVETFGGRKKGPNSNSE